MNRFQICVQLQLTPLHDGLPFTTTIAPAAPVTARTAVYGAGRGLHSSTFQLNLSRP
jgi:hypothetical protein